MSRYSAHLRGTGIEGAEAANTIFRQAFAREQVQTSQFNGKAERFALALLMLTEETFGDKE